MPCIKNKRRDGCRASCGYLVGLTKELRLFVDALELDLVLRTAFLPDQLARGDAVLDGADVQAQVAANALLIQDGLAVLGIPIDGLMAAVVAGHIAAAAANALVMIELGQDLVVTVQLLSGDDVAQSP